MLPVLRPRRLRAGDLVALLSPAGALRPEQHEQVAETARILAGWGLRTRFGAHALGRRGEFPGTGYLAGTDRERLADLNGALRDPEVRGIVCLRGGYGSQRIAEHLDVAAVRADPKVLLGFSDITALHLALRRETGLATVHGPTGVSLPPSAKAVRRALMTRKTVTLHGSDVVNPSGAVVAGPLLGGNLTMLATSAGTPDQPDLRGAVLLLEEVDEMPYQVDRMLTQLRRSGTLNGVAGVALGHFLPVHPREVLVDVLGPLGVPLLFGLEIGHGSRQAAVGLGVTAHLDPVAATLTVEPACR
jgi:muramoyltetrapeptide carboxypeptidase